MKQFYFSKLVILILILLGLNWNAMAQCNCLYQYKVPITVTNLGATALTNYQVSITLNTAALVSAGKMLASGNDIRFTDNSCNNLGYYIQSGMNTTTTLIWIKVGSIPASGSTTINMYYGNPTATAASNGDSTFVIFDDFLGGSLNTAKWTFVQSGGTSTVSGGTISLSTSVYAEIESNSSFPGPILTELMVVSTSGNWPSTAQADLGNYNSGATMFAEGTIGDMWFGPTSGSPGYSANLNYGYGLGSTSGLWTFVRTPTGVIGSWPSGSVSIGAMGSSANQSVAFGPLNGQTATMVVDWVRARQYSASGTSQTIGAEVLNTGVVPAIVGVSSICPGFSTTLTDPLAGGAWASSNSSVASIGSASGSLTGVASGTPTITYSVGFCTPATLNFTVNPTPLVSGTPTVCTGFTTNLSAAPSGGVWSSSSTSQATVNGTGSVTGVTAGIPNITYSIPGGCYTAYPVTVNLNPAAITGGTLICGTGQTTTLTEITTGGTWASSSTPVASISGTLGTSATIMGGAPGTAVISYNMPTGCNASTTVTVNNLVPFTVTGGGSYCSGSLSIPPVGLSGSTAGISYQLLNGGSPVTSMLGTGSAISFGPQPTGGIYTVIATNLSTGCNAPMTGSATITVNAAPTIFNMSSPLNASYCSGGSGVNVVLGGSTSGISYQLFNGTSPVGSPASGSGGSVNFGPQTAAGTYTVVATNPFTLCASNMNGSTTIAINPTPTAYAVSGGGSYCSGDPTGVHIGMSYSSSGVNYTLYQGAVPVAANIPGSNSGLDFGSFTAAGTYTVTATNAISGCSAPMSGSATITINSLPVPHNVTGTNGYCAGTPGVTVGLDGSNSGTNYQLYNGPTAVGGVVAGTGGPISFGVYAAGVYTVIGTNTTTGCSGAMAGNAIVTEIPLPLPFTLTEVGTGHYCQGTSGVDLVLSGSDGVSGISYQLFNGTTPVGGSTEGTGFPIDFGAQTAGSYTVVATTDVGGCTSTMPGTTTVYMDPLPTAFSVTGGGGYCQGSAGKHVGLSFSQVGVSYQLFLDGNPSGLPLISGTGSGIDFGVYTASGLYTVLATNTTSTCSNNMTGGVTIVVNPLPNNAYVVSTPGASDYCAGGTGIDIQTSASDGGINYQLFRGTTGIVPALPGTGGEGSSGLDFGSQLLPGTYTVVATNTTTGCTSTLSGSVTVVIDPLPNVYTLTGGGNYCNGGTGRDIMLSGSDSGVNYQLSLGSSPLPGGLVSGTGTSIDFGMQTGSGSYTVSATNATTGCSQNMPGAPSINILPLPGVHDVTGGGAYCMGGSGRHVGLDGSDAGIHYQLNDGSPVGPYLVGTGLPLDFGLKTAAAAYVVIATNPSTSCTDTMSNSATITINNVPNVYALLGGNQHICTGNTAPVALSGYDEGISYYLYRGTTLVDSIIDPSTPGFTSQSVGGVYTATAVDPSTGCSSNMAGRDTITIVIPTVYTVMGGGSYCEGGSGVHVGLSNSSTADAYQLYDGGSIGLPVTGTGGALDFGLQTATGTYTVIATDITYMCSNNMAGSATVNVNSLPGIHTVTGGGNFCAGGAGAHVGLNTTDETISYQLYNGSAATGSALVGSGSSLDFGLETAAGTYKVVATNLSTGCFDTMSSSAMIVVYPLPTPYTLTIDNFGNFCAADSGLHVRLANSQPGVTYQLYRGATPVGSTMTGTGSNLDFGLQVVAGSYRVVAHDTSTTCDNNMSGTPNLYIIPLPIVHNVTGGGGYCPGGAGVDVGLDGSQAGVWYQLYNGSTAVDTPMYGTGVELDFGMQPAGTYTIIGNSAITTCPNNMFGSVVVSVDTLLLPNITLATYPALGLGVWHIDSMAVLFTNGGSNPTFQWEINGNMISGATSSTFSHHEFFNGDSVVVMVTASGPCGGLTATKGIRLSLHDVSVAQVTGSGSEVRLIPNPNKGTFEVKGTLDQVSNEEVTLEVTNMLGQVMYTSKVMTQSGSIDEHIQLTGLANGMYLLNVRSATQNNVIHFVIEQ